MIGAFGDLEVFSFHATKFINTFEGGAIVTNDDVLAAKLRQMTVFGLDDAGHSVSTGINAKMTEVAAAMGLTLLESMDELVDVNYANYKQYQAELSPVPGLTLVTYDEDKAHNYQYVVVEVDETVTGLSRDHLLHVLRAENVLARRYFYPGCHRMEPYRTLFPRAERRLPVTEQLADRIMSLPTGTAVTSEDISLICNIIRTAVAEGPLIASRLDEVAIDEFAAVWRQTPLHIS
jgi:dTDP-4-amino-4,6-dideoxygalactose transaminase